MSLKRYIVALLVVLLLGVCAALFLLPAPQHRLDMVDINDVTARVTEHFDSVGSNDYLLPKSNYDYTVIDSQGRLLAATRSGLSEDIISALRHGDTIVDITRDGQILGKIIFSNNTEAQLKAYRSNLQTLVIVVLVAAAVVSLVFFYSIHRQVLKPFQSMKGFAQRVAAGELDAPLHMDRHNAFGAFTESFDLMREELRRARENEQAAERSKRELVASLSHDIQTPVSSIKAVAEVMEVTADEAQAQKLKTIQEKATQIQTLVTDLFHTTLEELDSLSVQVLPVPSTQVAEMLRAADYQNFAEAEELPGCLVQADPARLAQVLDNIFANSYKYAGTPIHVSARICDDFLVVTLRDFGPGVASEELPRLCVKYFRGKSAEGKNGYGLGLFIASHLVERMGGRLELANAVSAAGAANAANASNTANAANTQSGFAVHIWLRLDS